MTNGDKIRAMNNDEMVDFLEERIGAYCSNCPIDEYCKGDLTPYECQKAIMCWLESEAE